MGINRDKPDLWKKIYFNLLICIMDGLWSLPQRHLEIRVEQQRLRLRVR